MKKIPGILGLVWAALGIIPFICIGCKSAAASLPSLPSLPSVDWRVAAGFVGIFLILCLTEKIIDGMISRARKTFTKKI